MRTHTEETRKAVAEVLRLYREGTLKLSADTAHELALIILTDNEEWLADRGAMKGFFEGGCA